MEEFKSPVTRLARLFKKGRDNWKEKAILKQKKIRSLEIKFTKEEGRRKKEEEPTFKNVGLKTRTQYSIALRVLEYIFV